MATAADKAQAGLNAAERVRAYLDARAKDYMLPETKGVIAYVPPSITGTEQELREVDLETVLQMLDLMAMLISRSDGVTVDDLRGLVEAAAHLTPHRRRSSSIIDPA